MLLYNQIIQVNLTQEGPQRLVPGKSLDLTYSVTWSETDIAFARRFDVYLDYPFFEHQVLLAGSLFLVLRCVKLVSYITFWQIRKGSAINSPISVQFKHGVLGVL